MSALARGPGSSVLMLGTFCMVCRSSKPRYPALSAGLTRWPISDTTLPSFPSCAAGRVLQEHTLRRQVVADAVRRGEVAAAARRVAFFDTPIDVGEGNRGLLVFRPTQGQNTEDTIEPLEGRLNARHVT